jgi:hypothetical protein
VSRAGRLGPSRPRVRQRPITTATTMSIKTPRDPHAQHFVAAFGWVIAGNTSQRSMALPSAFMWGFKSAPVESRRCTRICNRPIAPSNSGCGLADFL